MEFQHQPDEYVDSRWEQIKTADPETSKKLKEVNKYLVIGRGSRRWST